MINWKDKILDSYDFLNDKNKNKEHHKHWEMVPFAIDIIRNKSELSRGESDFVKSLIFFESNFLFGKSGDPYNAGVLKGMSAEIVLINYLKTIIVSYK